MAENTTSINDLPTDPTGGGTISGNISLTTTENVNAQPSSGISLDQSTISQIVNGLQQASIAGMTSLPSRDIPQNTQQLTQDPYIQPNYVPPAPMNKRDFINEEIEMDGQFNYKDETTRNALDSIYDEFQTPLLLAVLYFVFQLPVFKKNVFKYASFLCNSDGNYNINGLIVVSGMFGMLYYSLSKLMVNFSRF